MVEEKVFIKDELGNKIKEDKISYLFIKRVIDILASILGLILLSPIFLIISILIKLDSKGPIFFSQERVGFKEKNLICTSLDQW